VYAWKHIVAHEVALLQTLVYTDAATVTVTVTAAVTVNAVLPGPTWTEGVAEFIKGVAAKDGVTVEQATADFFVKQEPTSLLGRFLKPEEVANAILYISSQVHYSTCILKHVTTPYMYTSVHYACAANEAQRRA
jgi:NAD(P)-dependent dehydrogenase (short-subunit alcohol dehydrogenase family)